MCKRNDFTDLKSLGRSMVDPASLCLFRERQFGSRREWKRQSSEVIAFSNTVTLALTNKNDMVQGNRPRANRSALADGCWDGVKHPAPPPAPSHFISCLFSLMGCSFSLSLVWFFFFFCGSSPIFLTTLFLHSTWILSTLPPRSCFSWSPSYNFPYHCVFLPICHNKLPLLGNGLTRKW